LFVGSGQTDALRADACAACVPNCLRQPRIAGLFPFCGTGIEGDGGAIVVKPSESVVTVTKRFM
jgi:hypothetical protein